MRKRFTLAGLSAGEGASSNISPSRGSDTESDSDGSFSSDEDDVLLRPLIRSNLSVARSMASAVADVT